MSTPEQPWEQPQRTSKEHPVNMQGYGEQWQRQEARTRTAPQQPVAEVEARAVPQTPMRPEGLPVAPCQPCRAEPNRQGNATSGPPSGSIPDGGSNAPHRTRVEERPRSWSASRQRGRWKVSRSKTSTPAKMAMAKRNRSDIRILMWTNQYHKRDRVCCSSIFSRSTAA